MLFNPNTYSIVKPVTWNQQAASSDSSGSTSAAGKAAATNRDLDAPPLVFGGGGARVLTLQLFFDVTEGGADGQTKDVRTETNKLVALTRIEPGHSRPPACMITWGTTDPTGSDFPFVGVVANLTQNFVMFRDNGQPVRANVTVVFNEYIDPEQNKRQNDPDLTTVLVKRGDTLSAIAARLYRDPTKWRVIAVANRIDDPRRIEIGKRLSIPTPT